MKIFLIGFMGSGKSTVGFELSRKINCDFVDTDKFIERKLDLSVKETFSRFGEEFFREKEREAIGQLASRDGDMIIATGGGCVLDERNVSEMKKNGKIIFLDVSYEKIMSRLKDDQSRPMLFKVDFSERCFLYENCADLIVDANLDVDSVCRQIMCALKQNRQKFFLMAGPCSVESEEQINYIADKVKKSGATHLRGGTFKLRTSPCAFHGLGKEGLKLLVDVKKRTGLPIVTEITKISQIEMFEDVDVIQVGARNAQNFELLRELGKTDKTILLKRGFSMSFKEFVAASQYVTNQGNTNVILCERGIKTFETYTRNTFDVSAIPVLKKMSGLPVIADPSHAGGRSWLVESLSLAAVAAGACGLMIEVHHDRRNALCDGKQSITPDEFDLIARKIFSLSRGRLS